MRTGYTYNKHHLIKDGTPWFPVMGEMHYSRYCERYWEESLRKIKAGGITIVSTYVIWIHHEEEEGVFDFEGCRNLEKFILLCRKVGLSVFLRLGPWVHGEVRNGGFPDWLMNKGIALRTDDGQYLELVERFWNRVYQQVQGQMYEDGGPVIGIQIENEYGHVGGLRGEAGEQHMRRLTKLAKKIGFNVPLYTATGWGGAVIGDLLPVMGGYCEAPWDQRLTELELNENYVFSGKRNDTNIASDHHMEDTLTFDVEDYPYLTAELGGGLQVTEHRRPVASGSDIGAMSLVKLGSGIALLGYYMYHGGSNPKGKISTLQESKATGYLNNLPEINYDFNAPIRQYGQISNTYKELKLLGLFLQDFGGDIATLHEEIMPPDVKPEDIYTLRTSSRHDHEHGYVFFNNYQRRLQLEEHSDVILTGPCRKPVSFPPIQVKSKEYGFFPYNMKLGKYKLISALATPLCKLELKDDAYYVFYGDREPLFHWEAEAANTIHLNRNEALNAWKITLDQDYLVIADNYVWEQEGEVCITGGKETEIRCFPELNQPPAGFTKEEKDGIFSVYRRRIKTCESSVVSKVLLEESDIVTYELKLTYGDKVNDCLIHIEYAGDKLDVYSNDEKISDHFYTGQRFEISARYFEFPSNIVLKVKALYEDMPRFLEQWPVMKDGKACELISVTVQDQYI